MVSVLVASATAALLLGRPRQVAPPLIACLAALALLLLGQLAPTVLLEAGRDFAPVLGFLVFMLLAATLADSAQLFDWASQQAARLARGSGRRLFLASYLLGAATTLLFSLDVTAVLLTPVLCRLALRAEVPARPYLVATAVVANTASLALPVSNLTNLLVSDLLGIGFWPFLGYLALPNLVALAIGYGLLVHRYRAEIDRPLARTSFAPADAALLGQTRWLVGGLLLGLLAAGPLGVPYWMVAGLGALALAVPVARRGRLSWRTLVAGSGWSLPLLVLGLYAVVYALRQVWQEPALPGEVGPALVVGAMLVATAASNLFNNLPAALWMVDLLRAAPESARLPLALGGLLGTNLGPLLTPTGSLATLLVLGWGRRLGVHVGGAEVVALGLRLVPAMLGGAGLALLVLLGVR